MLVNQLYDTTISYSKEVSKISRKKIGQFFTPPSVAKYMASLMDYKKSSIRILEPGAGTLMLTGALCDEIILNKFIKTIHVDLFETDEKIIPLLRRNMEMIKKTMEDNEKHLTYTIIQENFILYHEFFWKDIDEIGIEPYDLAICNPPYKKIGKNDEEAIVMSSIVYGQPNIYFLFMALSAKLLKDDGQLIFITPRSFTSGAYFKKFREYFLNTVRLTNLHLFHSREDVFDSDSVLQEAIILKAVKSTKNTKSILISASENMHMDKNVVHKVPYDTVLSMQSENLFIMIPTSEEEIKLLNSIKRWKYNLLDLGFQLKTGPVVDFRAKEYLKEEIERYAVPLIWANNFSDYKIKHPDYNSKNPQYIMNLPTSQSLLLKSKDFIIVKRFTSKEEKRRIQCALYLEEQFTEQWVGIENHLNYVTKLNGEITKEELYGLFALLNSTMVDTYYRILNGSTQVNATEANAIPLPNLKTVVEIGKGLINMDSLSTDTCDTIIKETIGNNDVLTNSDTQGDKRMVKVTIVKKEIPKKEKNPKIEVTGKLKEANEILNALGFPQPKSKRSYRNEYVLLSLAGLKEDDEWAEASINSLRTKDMMDFMEKNYGKKYAANSREDIRKSSVKPLVNAAIAENNADDNERATNSGDYSYQLTKEALDLIKTYGNSKWDVNFKNWLANHETLRDRYEQKREMVKIPVRVNGKELKFSPGKHNQLQKAIIEEFAPRFAQGSEILYVGDTAKRDLVKNREKLLELGVKITDHDKLPDVVLYMEDKNWLFFVEAVTSVGPVSKQRMDEINAMLDKCTCGIIYVTAFLDMSSKNGFKKFIDEIAWETEVWVADNPDHMIHLNGDRFMGPR
jgi:adenine-specific DNA-methyltransferase